jgi:DNA-binding MarR family transcriptional regulator
MQVPPDIDPLVRDLGLVVRQTLMRSNRGVYEALDDLDLPFSQTKIVMSFTGRPEPRSLGSIAEELGLSLPAVSRAVDGLSKRGLVTRTEDPADRRTKLVAPTASGQEVVQRLFELRVTGLQDFVASLSDDERDALAAALAPIAARDDLFSPRTQKDPANA